MIFLFFLLIQDSTWDEDICLWSDSSNRRKLRSLHWNLNYNLCWSFILDHSILHFDDIWWWWWRWRWRWWANWQSHSIKCQFCERSNEDPVWLHLNEFLQLAVRIMVVHTVQHPLIEKVLCGIVCIGRQKQAHLMGCGHWYLHFELIFVDKYIWCYKEPWISWMILIFLSIIQNSIIYDLWSKIRILLRFCHKICHGENYVQKSFLTCLLFLKDETIKTYLGKISMFAGKIQDQHWSYCKH